MNSLRTTILMVRGKTLRLDPPGEIKFRTIGYIPRCDTPQSRHWPKVRVYPAGSSPIQSTIVSATGP